MALGSPLGPVFDQYLYMAKDESINNNTRPSANDDNKKDSISTQFTVEQNSTIPLLNILSTVILSQHLFTESRLSLACTQNGTPLHLAHTK